MECFSDDAETYIAQDSVIRSMLGTRYHGLIRNRPYTIVWTDNKNSPTNRLRKLLEKCKIVPVQLDMQFRGSAHAGVLFFDTERRLIYLTQTEDTNCCLRLIHKYSRNLSTDWVLRLNIFLHQIAIYFYLRDGKTCGGS